MGSRFTGRAIAVVLTVMTATLITSSPAQARASATPSTRGTVAVTFDPAFVQAMFKAGVFMYGSSEVTVYMGDSGALSGSFPLDGQSRARATSSITVDPEVGGLTLYNGPAQSLAGISSLVVRRAGATGTVTAKITGPFSMQNGQFEKTLVTFTISQASARGTPQRWTMNGTISLTRDAADTLNTLLKTTVFVADAPIGTLGAAVKAPSGS